MDSTITALLRGIRLGDPVGTHGLTFVPVFCKVPPGPDYLTLAEAVEADSLVVTEMDAGATVPALEAHNVSARPVLILDGEELLGAKQNRVLNTTVLIAAGSSYKLPVTCVEQGRWNMVSARFAASGHHATRNIRAINHRAVAESLRAAGGYEGAQGKVWQEVRSLHARHGVISRTEAMYDAYESRAAEVGELIGGITPLEGQNGLLALLGGEVLGLDVVSRPSAYARVHDKLARSYAVDVTAAKAVSHTLDLAAAKQFVASLSEMVGTEHDSPGMGRSHRYTSESIVGSALTYRRVPVHAAFFAAKPGGDR